MDGLDYRQVVHFTSLTEERGGPGQGGRWIWTQRSSGPLGGGSGGGIVSSPITPNDPDPHGSLHLTAQSLSSQTAKFGFYANSQPAGLNYRDNLNGQSLSIDILLNGGWSNGYLELLIASSYHEASAGRPAGDYSLSYQFVPSGEAGRTAQGLQGVITIPVTPSPQNPWYTATVTPADDIAALWPDLDYRDFALWELTLNAVSTGDLVDGYFDYLRFDRTISGEAFLQQQVEMEALLAPRYPDVAQRQGLEVSWLLPHVNWFGGSVTVPDYSGVEPAQYSDYLQNTVIPGIHSGGGLVSYNHPYGYDQKPILPVAKQNELLAEVATLLLPTADRPAALGTDLLEVGYRARAGVDLAHHVALWDIMSRNAIFLTGNGVNDDHYGVDWRGEFNNWFTTAWAASTAEADLLAALAAGRIWCASLSAYQGSLDLLVDGSCPMGSVSVSGVNSRQLVATATQLPPGGSLQILQGTVDYAGTSGLESNAEVIGTFPAAEVARGGWSVSQPIDTSQASFVRTQVLQGSGAVVGLSNPVWLLRSTPPEGIPAPRST
jgi:hypothetical protein